MRIISVFVSVLSVLLWSSSVSSSEEHWDPNAPKWEGHDYSTLKLLQIVHRHGERTVLKGNLPKNDPFLDISHWEEGFGQLTTKGKRRMYTMGTYLRQWYDKDYLDKNNPDHSPRRVYARSSIEHRCIESVSALLAGMYNPKGNWTWDDQGLGQQWQPFPIETFSPKDEDTLLVPHKKCPKAQDEHNLISSSEPVKEIIRQLHNKTIYPHLKKLFEEPIDYLYRGQQYWDSLKIEKDANKTWPQLGPGRVDSYSQDNVIDALEPLGVGSYVYDWNRPFILKIRVGNLIETLTSNMKSVINGQTAEERKELYIYSTHDSIVVPLMQALGQYNNATPPYGGAVLFELHENQANILPRYFVRIYYYNETDKKPTSFMGVDKTLSFEKFEQDNKQWYYSDFDKECGIEGKPNLILSEMTFMVIGIAIGIGLLGLNIFAFKFIRQRKNSFQITK